MKQIVRKSFFALFVTVTMHAPLKAQNFQLSREDKNEIFSELTQYLSISNVSDDVKGIQKNLDFLTCYLVPLGFEVSTWKVNDIPYLYADLNVGGEKTLLIYLQLDALPADASKWEQPDPFFPVLMKEENKRWVEARLGEKSLDSLALFARGASDSKGPTYSLLYALKYLSKNGLSPKVNIKIIGDTEEEKGSKNLTSLLKMKSNELRADALLILDGTRSLADVPTLTFGARGIATMQLTVYGAPSQLHSGQYSGISPNPWYLMNELIGSMVGENEQILIEDFDPYKESTAELSYFKSLQLGTFEQLESRLESKLYTERIHPQQVYQHPSLILRDISANLGSVKTRIPTKVTAEFELRLTPETPAQRQFDLIKKHIEKRGFLIIDNQPTNEQRQKFSKILSFKTTAGSVAFRTRIDSKFGDWLENGIKFGIGDTEVLKLNTTGGSQPIGTFIDALKIEGIALRIPNPDAQIHAANENIRLQNVFDGIKSLIGILTQPNGF